MDEPPLENDEPTQSGRLVPLCAIASLICGMSAIAVVIVTYFLLDRTGLVGKPLYGTEGPVLLLAAGAVACVSLPLSLVSMVLAVVAARELEQAPARVWITWAFGFLQLCGWIYVLMYTFALT